MNNEVGAIYDSSLFFIQFMKLLQQNFKAKLSSDNNNSDYRYDKVNKLIILIMDYGK